mgnify:CR=1 FL=1
MTNYIYSYEFIDNKYSKWYFNIIKNAKTSVRIGYTEKHHIIPKSLKGSNIKDNIVKLTAREHYICHILLTKMVKYRSIDFFKLINAVIIMKADHTNNRVTSKMYDSIKKEYSFFRSMTQSGSGNSQFNTCYISNFSKKSCIKIPKEQLDSYLERGWHKCRVLDFSKYDLLGNLLYKRKPKPINYHRKKYMRSQSVDGPYSLISTNMFRTKSDTLYKLGFDFESDDFHREYRRIQLQLVFDKHYLKYREIRQKYNFKSDRTISQLYEIFNITLNRV